MNHHEEVWKKVFDSYYCYVSWPNPWWQGVEEYIIRFNHYDKNCCYILGSFIWYVHKFYVKLIFLTLRFTHAPWCSVVAPWCSGFHYCTASFNEAWTQVLCSYKYCLLHAGDSRWWGFLTMVATGNKAKRLSLINHTTKAIHHHHHHTHVCVSGGKKE